MNGLENTKYMEIFTIIGYICAFIVGISCVFTRKTILLIPAVVLIFAGRLIGYGIDRLLEMKEK